MQRIRCVLDLQGAQGESAFRGIGRYSLNFARAVARTAADHEVWIVLNGLFPETAAALRAEFTSWIPQNRIVTFSAPGPVAEVDPANAWRRTAAEAIREHFLAALKPDVVHVSSMVEGFVDESVTSLHDASIATAVTFYDAIPYLYQKQYLLSPDIISYYLRKLRWLKCADLLLAISESSRREAIEVLNITDDRVCNISTGLEEHFQKITISPEARSSLFNKYGISKSFLMYSGATDTRKNMEGLIAAFALLPPRLRGGHQILLAGKNDAQRRKALQELARSHGLRDGSLIFTGFVEDADLLALYNTCSLFVLPSYHEGFGLPALEAMACGAPTIVSNVTSLPEVVGYEEALFNPYEPADIAAKLERGLACDEFRDRLREHGLERSKQFTWERTARVAWSAFEELKSRRQPGNASLRTDRILRAKPKMAYFSPLPPEKSGIADYSAELLPELARFYQIEVVVEQDAVTDTWVNANFPVRSVSFFDRHAAEYDRIVYQMGNSPFHIYMFDALRRYPGVIVLHDFFLSGIFRWMAETSGKQAQFSRAVFDSHGYMGLLKEREFGRDWAASNFPCNLPIIQAAAGVIVHSQFSRDAADQWYGPGTSQHWKRIPHLRSLQSGDRQAARTRLGIPADDYVVCSFGLVDSTKLHHRLLSGWLDSQLAHKEHCHLVFVGENNGAEYGRQLLDRINKEGAGRVRITGYASRELYLDYLAAADSAVQLRTMSRGETSGALLDCLGHGLPAIINSHATLAEVPDEVVHKLPDLFTDSQLSQALDQLYSDAQLRHQLTEASREYVKHELHPARIAELYRDAIESFASDHPVSVEQRLVLDLASMSSNVTPSQNDLVAAARAISMNRNGGKRQLLLDVSATAKNDLKTGIERVARNLSRELIKSPGEWRVEPVRFKDGQRLYARTFGLQLVDAQLELEEPAVEFRTGDLYLALDWCPETVVEDQQFFSNLRALNIPIYFLIHDVLPLLRPEKFPDWAVDDFRKWFGALCEFSDGLICVSRSVADGVFSWLEAEQPNRARPLKIGYSYSGADVLDMLPRGAASEQGLSSDADAAVVAMKSRPSLLMVGTLEPRKGHTQALDAFELLWADGVEANLVIIGHEGWHVEDLVGRLTRHRFAGKYLFWLSQADDHVLSLAYKESSGLLAASEGEGFGLPLIEAARYGLPILARDLPVFREVAGKHASYFQGKDAAALRDAIRGWLNLSAEGKVPSSKGLKWLTWADSAAYLLNTVTSGKFYREWTPTADERNRDLQHVKLAAFDAHL